MKKIEWIREALSVWPSTEYLKHGKTAGWRMVAVEWEREVQVEIAPTSKELAPGEESPMAPALPATASIWKRTPPKCKF